MKIVIPCDWKTVDLLTTKDANEFGEALRGYCFVGNSEQTGCYSTFNLIGWLEEVKSGKIYEEAKNAIFGEYEEEEGLKVFHFHRKEKDCWISYDDPEGKPGKMKFGEPQEIVCAYCWSGGDGTLYFRFNNRKVINTDCKCDYYWNWIE